MASIKLPKVAHVFSSRKEISDYIRAFNFYLVANELSGKSEEVKIAHMRCSFNDKINDIIDKMTGQKTVESVMKYLEEQLIPSDNTCFNQYVFFNRSQKEGENFNDYYLDLDHLATKCNLGDKHDEILKARLVCGIGNPAMRERLMRTPDMSLKDVIQYCRLSEDAKSKVNEMEGLKSNGQVHAIVNSKYKQPWRGNKNKYCNAQNRPQKTQNQVNHKSVNQEMEFKCSRCRTWHTPRNCPAFNKLCNKCHRPNHFSIACRFNQKKLHMVENDSSNQEEEMSNTWQGGAMLDVLKINSIGGWSQTFKIAGIPITFKLDTGADICVLPESIARKIKPNFSRACTVTAVEAFGGHRIEIVGNVPIKMKRSGESCVIDFSVIQDGRGVIPILGHEACEKLGLIKKLEILDNGSDLENFLNKYSGVFEGLGTFPQKYKIEVDSSSIPTNKPPRRVAFALMEKLKHKLTQLVESKIIEPVNQPNNWCSNLVIREKPNGDLRLCLDPMDLNKVLKREHFLIPTLEEIKTKLVGKSYFSVIDLKDGFHQILLDEESRDYCTFSSPYGYFRYLRVPFGLNTSPEIFMKYNIECFKDIEDLVIYFDDLLIASKDKQSHIETLSKVFQRATELNIKFNRNKLQLMKNEFKYLGHKFNKDGCQIDPERIEAIKQLKEPKSVKELQSILGMFNYMRDFIPQMAQLTTPLRVLLRKGVVWHWTDQQKIAFENLKEAVSKPPILKNFDPSKDVVIQTDSSQYGVGSVLLQDKQPVAFASRSLTDTEIKYSQIEKETLAIKYACRKFHNYIWGKKIVIHSDHLPLMSIFRKNIAQIVSDRIVRMRLSLLKYDLDVQYLPGKQMFIADLLSRNCLSTTYNNEIEVTGYIHNIYKPDNLLSYELIKNEINQNPDFCKIIDYIDNGWPNNKNNIGNSEIVRHYFKIRNQLMHTEGIIYFNDRIVIPDKLKELALKMLHSGHHGVTKTLLRANQTYYWINLSNDIESYVKKCLTCQENRNSKIKEPMICYEIPDRPFQRLGLDIMTFKSKDYLVIIDSFSKWIECVKLNSKTCSEIILKLKNIFSQYGIPEIVVSDNSPFNSIEMRQFANNYNIEWKTSSPHYPISNGLAERAVGICKDLLKKACSSEADFTDLLMEYRATPIPSIGYSPSEMLMGRLIRTKLLINNNKLKPHNNFQQISNQVQNKLKINQSKLKIQYDKTSKTDKEFGDQENVLVQEEKKWVKGKILNKTKYPRSYNVRTEKNQILRRNSKFLRHTPLVFECPVSNSNAVDNDIYDDCLDFKMLSRDKYPIDVPVLSDGKLVETNKNSNSNTIQLTNSSEFRPSCSQSDTVTKLLSKNEIVKYVNNQLPSNNVQVPHENESYSDLEDTIITPSFLDSNLATINDFEVGEESGEEFNTPHNMSINDDHNYSKLSVEKGEDKNKRKIRLPMKLKDYDLY